MEFPEFDALEAKITKVLEKIEAIKIENQGLQSRYESLERDHKAKIAKLKKVESELSEVKANSLGTRKIEAIRKKISNLLVKLEKV